MKIEAAVVFPAEADVVFHMMTDEEYVSRKATRMGALEHDASVQTLPEGGARIRLERTLPAVVPDFVKPFVGETVEVEQTEEWAPPEPDGSRRGVLSAQISHAPVKLSGTISLEPNGAHGSIHRVNVDVRAKVPLIGGRIEKAIGEVILMAARKEEEVGGEWLAERG